MMDSQSVGFLHGAPSRVTERPIARGSNVWLVGFASFGVFAFRPPSGCPGDKNECDGMQRKDAKHAKWTGSG